MKAERILELRHVSKRFGDTVTARDLSLAIDRGEFFTLLGPSGSGKSTILRMIAGLEQPDSGAVLIGGADVTQTPPWQRRLGMVFQQYANFPHMNVAGNVGYGLRRSGLTKTEIAERVRDLLRLVSLQGFETRRVQHLSGGEQQRVAMARALAPRPRILLLDEPLAALDEKIRREMQLELRSIQQRTGTTFIYVTHDQEEALTMSDRIAVLNRGECVQCDLPDRIFRRPRTAFVARFFRGSNVVLGKVRVDGSRAMLELPGVAEAIPLSESRPPGQIEIAIRAERVALGPDAVARPLRFTAHLETVVYRGVYSEYLLRLPDGQTLSATQTHQPAISPGKEVLVGFEPDDLVELEPGS